MEPNYKEMYYTLMDAAEKMIEILIKAQNDCEEIYIREDSGEAEKK